MTRFIDLTLNGISTGAIYAAVALALVLIWRATRIVNFAQGGMLMITTFIASAVIGSSGSYWLGFAVALACGLVLGALVERVLMRRVEGGPPLNAVIVALGLLILLEAGAGMIWGNTPRSFPPAFSIRGYKVGGTTLLFSPNDTFTVLVVIAVAAGLALLFRYTALGLRMRAAALAPEVARLLGVRVGRMFTLGWALAAFVGSLAGLLVAPSVFVGPNQFDPILIFGFTAAVLGGLDSPPGRGRRRHPARPRALLRLGLRGRLAGHARGARRADRGADDPARRALLDPQGATRMSAVLTRLRVPQSTLAALACARAARRSGAVRSSASCSVRYNDLQLASGCYYFVVLAGLTMLTGLSGQISLGHGALMAVGAYTVALLVGNEQWALVPALVAAIVVTAFVGVLVGAAATRLRGPYLAGATLAFAIGLPALADKYPNTFGGENGLIINPPTPPSWLGASFPLERWEAWIAGVGALVVVFVMHNITRSGVGRSFRAVRDDEIAASLCGLHVGRVQTLAFIISAACAGLGGGLLAVVLQLAAPGAFEVGLSLSLLTAIVLGGLGSPSARSGARRCSCCCPAGATTSRTRSRCRATSPTTCRSRSTASC